MQMRFLAICMLMGFGMASAAHAQDYPNRGIRMLVPFAPGGNTDILARIVGHRMSESWGKPVVIDNRAGGSGVIATEMVAKAAPDGYTVLVGSTGEIAINPSLFAKLPYDVEKDFAPVALGTISALLLVAHPSLPAKSVKELLDLAKAKPKSISYASIGTGSPMHLSGELFKVLTQVDIVHVPYKGGALVTNALLGNEVSIGFVGMGPVIPHINSGKLKALAISTAKRSTSLPEVPTLQEAGVKDFDTSIWFAFFAPARTPQNVIAKLGGELVRILKLPDVVERLVATGVEVAPGSPEELARYVKSETVKYRRIIERSGTRLD
jgi:tripartite-type tricarboxylate transporter receptor subunit TctC